jgi:hypothetical protein
VNRLLNKESSEDDVEKQAVKKRRVMGSSGKSQNIANCRNDQSSSVENVVQSNSRSLSETNLAVVNKGKESDASKTGSCSDSTSDTSDEDQSYIPFSTKSVKPRGRGKPRGKSGASRTRGSQRTGAKKYTRKKHSLTSP